MAVDDLVHWHQQNLKHNPTHYSFLRYSGTKNVQRWAGQIYYNMSRNKWKGMIMTAYKPSKEVLCTCDYMYSKYSIRTLIMTYANIMVR